MQEALRNRGLLYFYMPTSKDIIYYTDFHDVDENRVTSNLAGGSCAIGGLCGVTCLQTMNPPTDAYDAVASRLIYLS